MRHKKVKEIVFCFENLEEFVVSVDQVDHFTFLNIHKDIYMWGGASTMEMTVADECVVLLKPGADKVAVSSFDLLTGSNSQPGLFERLSVYRDCVSVDLIYENGKRKEIYLPWDDDGDPYTNKNMSTFMQENSELRGEGCFCVHIGRNKELKKFYCEKHDVS